MEPKTSKESCIDAINCFVEFLILRAPAQASYAVQLQFLVNLSVGFRGYKTMLSPGLIEGLGQIVTGLKFIGDGLTFLLGFILNTLGVPASQQMVQMATIMILLAVVWKIGSKLTSSIFWFFIAAQAMSFVGTI